MATDTDTVTAVQIVSPADGLPDTLVPIETTVSAPTHGQVRVDVRAVGVNPTDWKSLTGTWPRTQALPVGFEASGVVAAVGDPASRDLQIGDEVIVFPAPGAYASVLLVPVDSVVPKPRRLDFAQAANLLLVGTTAAEMLHAVPAFDGETVLVHGASGATGLSLLQQMSNVGARVIATCAPANADLVRSFGGHPVAYGPGLAERVRSLSAGPVHAAYDCVGTFEALTVSIDLVEDRDRIVTIVDREQADRSAIRFIDGRDPASYAFRHAQRSRLVGLADAGALAVPMAGSFPLTRADDAWALARSGHPGGKLALIPDFAAVTT